MFYVLNAIGNHSNDNSLSADEITGDKHDLTRVCKQVMNKSTTKRLISKPEAVCILGKLDMTKCTETIVNSQFQILPN